MNSSENYERIQVEDAREGDQLLQAGEWVTVESVHFVPSAHSVVFRFPGGGSHSMPVAHRPALRREVPQEEAPAPAAYRRKTSGYTLRVSAETGDLRAQLDSLVAALPAEAGVIDQHYADDEDGSYLSVTWRAGSPEAAAATAEEVLGSFPGAEAFLHTGLGVHRRVVKRWSPGYADRIEEGEPRCECAAAYLGHSAHTPGCPLDNSPDAMERFVEDHRALGHEAVFTVAGAPGTGRGTWCRTCRTYGPSSIRVLSPEETR